MKCFSIDLDGTLLNSNHQISAENLKVLQDLKEQGHCVIINSGRAIEDIILFDELQKLKIPIITINGTVLYSETGEILYEASLPMKTYRKLFPILSDIGLRTMVYTNQGGFPCRNPDLINKTPEEIEAIFKGYNYHQLFERENIKIYKVMAVSTLDESEKIDAVKKVVEGKFDISMASSHPNNIEFTSIEANKGTALLRYQKLTGVSFDAIFAFGDGGNDVEQFKVATQSIAMANAPKHIQAAADFVSKSNDEDGFAYAVRELLNF